MRLPFISSRLVSNLLFLSLSLFLTYMVFKDMNYSYGFWGQGYTYRMDGTYHNSYKLKAPIIELLRLYFPGISFTSFLLLRSWPNFNAKQRVIRMSYWLGMYIVTFYFTWVSLGLGLIFCGGLGAQLINNTIEREKVYPNWVMFISGSLLGLLGLYLSVSGNYFVGGNSTWVKEDGIMYLYALLPWQIGIGAMLVFSKSILNSNDKAFTIRNIVKAGKLILLFLLLLLLLNIIIFSVS